MWPLIFLGGLALFWLIFGGVPIFLAAFTQSYLLIGVIIFVLLWKLGIFERILP